MIYITVLPFPSMLQLFGSDQNLSKLPMSRGFSYGIYPVMAWPLKVIHLFDKTGFWETL